METPPHCTPETVIPCVIMTSKLIYIFSCLQLLNQQVSSSWRAPLTKGDVFSFLCHPVFNMLLPTSTRPSGFHILLLTKEERTRNLDVPQKAEREKCLKMSLFCSQNLWWKSQCSNPWALGVMQQLQQYRELLGVSRQDWDITDRAQEPGLNCCTQVCFTSVTQLFVI